MLGRFVFIAGLATASAGLCMPALGAASGLNIIPTADVLDKGVVSLEIETAGNDLPWGDGCDGFALFQAGLGSGIEVGVDRCLSDPNTWFNAKWRVNEESVKMPAFALGVQAIKSGEPAEPYIVASKSAGTLRLHTGAIAIDHKTRYMLGMDHPMGNRATFQADYISGAENSATYGVAVDLSDGLSLTVARSIGNSSETGNGYLVNLAWSKAWH